MICEQRRKEGREGRHRLESELLIIARFLCTFAAVMEVGWIGCADMGVRMSATARIGRHRLRAALQYCRMHDA